RPSLKLGGPAGERGKLPHAPQVAPDGLAVDRPEHRGLIGRAGGGAAGAGATVPADQREARAAEVAPDWRTDSGLHRQTPAVMLPEGPTRTNTRTNARPALASRCERGSEVVPGARFELARGYPYAPQTYVSTKFHHPG